MIPNLALAFAVFQLSVKEVRAQERSVRDTSESREVTAADEISIEEATRDVAAAARRHLETALGSDLGYVRWNALRAARTLSAPWIAESVLPFCDSPDLTERSIALEAVANTDPGLGRAAFLDALTSEERSIRLRGVLGLAALGDGNTVPNLVTIMKEDPDPDLQAAAARALGDIRDVRASIPLYESIESRLPAVREQAVMALMAISGEDVGEYLVGWLREDHDPGETEILKLLALVPDPALVGLIEPFLKHDDDDVRTMAAAAIISILDRSRSSQP